MYQLQWICSFYANHLLTTFLLFKFDASHTILNMDSYILCHMRPIESILHQTSGSINPQMSKFIVDQLECSLSIFQRYCKLISQVVMILQLDSTIHKVMQNHEIFSIFSICPNFSHFIWISLVGIKLALFRWFKFTLKPPYSIARGKL